MKKHGSSILLIVLLLIGLSLVLYPTVSDWWNSMHQSKAIVDYDRTLAQLEKEDYTAIFAEAEEYNRRIKELDQPLLHYEEVPGYHEALNLTGNGIMGYIQIPKIDVTLPFYHGTAENVLQVAVGHLEGTSLPIGGPGTHCVFSAHRGLPSARLFTDLDKIDIGDIFTLTVLDRLMTYQVDQILVVEPRDVESLYVVDGEDYCTLITCTPYGINTHRMLVRGHRIENAEVPVVHHVTADAVLIEPIIVAPVVAVPILLILLLIPKPRKYRR
jgi:sortase A